MGLEPRRLTRPRYLLAICGPRSTISPMTASKKTEGVSSDQVSLPPGYKLLACEVFAPELEQLGIPLEAIRYLDPGLHMHPKHLAEEVAKALAELEADQDIHTVIVVFGYCGGGLEGLSSQRLRLILPLVHDCIPLLLGKNPPQRPQGQGETFYLSAGWIDHGKTPFTEYERVVDKFSEEDALWVGKEMLAGYDSITLITGQKTKDPRYKEYSQKCADLFDLAYQEMPGSLGWLRRLLSGQESREVVLIPPGQTITLEMFLEGEPSVRLTG